MERFSNTDITNGPVSKCPDNVIYAASPSWSMVLTSIQSKLVEITHGPEAGSRLAYGLTDLLLLGLARSP